MDFGQHVPGLVIIGAAVIAGSMGARLFQRLRIPQVVGYIVIGLLLGRSGLHFITLRHLDSLRPFSFVALGLIGFNIGGELRASIFRKYGRQFFVILFSEGMGAFLLVTPLTTFALWLVLHDLPKALALGLLLGAISSATAPAATVDVLWEYKTRGMLTTTVLAIVALDDGLALILYAIASSVAFRLLGAHTGLLPSLLHTSWEIFGGVGLGLGAGFLLTLTLRKAGEYGRILCSILGTLVLVLGIAAWIRVDLILAAMAMGCTVANLLPHRSREAFSVVERFAPPIYVLFFVMVGARLQLHGLPLWAWGVATAYVVGRTAGKMLGAWLGATWTRAAESVRRYPGLCLFSQAGVAIGLALLAGMHLTQPVTDAFTLGDMILMVVTVTTFLVQIIGPPCVKIAAQKAGEVGLNVTEEDLMHDYTVEDAMLRNVPVFNNDAPLRQVLAAIADSTASMWPVVDRNGRLAGVVTLEGLKPIMADPAMAEWMVVEDVLEPCSEPLAGNTPLPDALSKLRAMQMKALPVVDPQSHEVRGVFEEEAARQILARELLLRRIAAGDPEAAGDNPQATASAV